MITPVRHVIAGVVAEKRATQPRACICRDALWLVRITLQQYALRHRKIDAGIEQVRNSQISLCQMFNIDLG